MYITCDECDGSGSAENYCSNCSGSGEGMHDDAICWRCHGIGIIGDGECRKCAGTGEVLEDDYDDV